MSFVYDQEITASELNNVRATTAISESLSISRLEYSSVSGTSDPIYIRAGGYVTFTVSASITVSTTSGYTITTYPSSSIRFYLRKGQTYSTSTSVFSCTVTAGESDKSNYYSGTVEIDEEGWYIIYIVYSLDNGESYMESGNYTWESTAGYGTVGFSADFYCFNEAVKGDYLVYYEDPTLSASRITETILTAEILNSGRVTTVASL